MGKVFSSLLICCFYFFTYAQSTGKINGIVATHQQALEYATVSIVKLPDTTKVLYRSTTDSLGNFSFCNIALGDYLLKITLIGYQTTTQEFSLTSDNSNLNFYNLSLLAETNTLATVTVSSQKKLIQKTTTGFIVNAAANISQIGGTATDLLKSTPTVSVDAEGGITLRGKAPLILINGRNSVFSSIDQIPASNIESIEIINNASAKYDANAQSGIINIVLKKNRLSGTNGAVSLGAGVGSRGRTANAIILNHKTVKLNVGFGYDNRFAGRTKHNVTNRTNYNLSDIYLINQERKDERVEQLQNLKLNIDFTPNDKSAFSFEAIGNVVGQDNDETLKSKLSKQDKTFNTSNRRHSLEIIREKLAEFALGYNRKFRNPKKTLSANLTSSFEKGRENTSINTQNLYENESYFGDPFFQNTHNYEDSYVHNAIVDYAMPIFRKGILETGYKATSRNVKNDFEAADKIGNAYIINPASTNTFKFNEQVHAAYLLFHSYIGKEESPRWKYEVGIRAEQVNNKGETQNNSTKFTNQYFKFFPTSNLSYFIANSQFLKISYAKRINRPDLDDLNPFVDITDALNIHSGNPYLKPEIIQAFEIGYNYEWKNLTLSSSLFYRNTKNTIRNFSQFQPNGIVLRSPVNIGNANSYGIENIITLNPTRIYELNASFTLFQQAFNSSNIAVEAIQNSFNWYGKLINNFAIDSRRKLQIIGNYNSAQTTPQGNQIPVYNFDLGFQQKLGKGNSRLGLVIVDVLNTLKSGSNTFSNDFKSIRTQKADTRFIMLTFAYSFKSTFKEKLLENKFSKEF